MWSIATVLVSFSENGFWLGIGLWGLLVGSVGSSMLTALGGTNPATLTSVSREPQAPVSPRHGLLQELARPLQDRTHLTVTDVGREARMRTPLRGLSPHMPGVMPASNGIPRFVVSCSATVAGDTVSIEVRLTDPQTKKLLAVTNMEGRPEDLSQEIRARFREDAPSIAPGEESPAERAVRAAIVKVATWIEEPPLDSVMVKASRTRVKEAPSLQSATLSTVRQEARLQKIGTEGEWIRIRLDRGAIQSAGAEPHQAAAASCPQ